MSQSESPPAWAMEKARGIVAKRFAADSKTVAIALSGAMDQHEPDILDIARAIAEADKAATERAAVWHENEAHQIELEAHRKRGARAKTRQPMWHRRAAAAIRGAGHE